MKFFNTAGTCRPNEHYMVDITERLAIIRKMIAKGDYFCINRGRQFGKTTTLKGLKHFLEEQGYSVFYVSFESFGDYYFESEEKLGAAFLNSMCWCLQHGLVCNNTSSSVFELLRFRDNNSQICPLMLLRQALQIFTSSSLHPVVLLIDEVDQASNHLSFIRFLGMLRDMYLQRDDFRSFQSVILAGVYDIKNLKLKMRPEESHQYNSPWNVCANESRASSSLESYAECSQTSPYGNIAVPFNVDMSLSAQGIAGMLAEYKADHSLSFDETQVAQLIRSYTSGYPFLVSRICQLIDEEQWTWDKAGVQKAVNAILMERNTLFDNMIKKLDEYPELEATLRKVLFSGSREMYNPDEKYIQIGTMFNYIDNQDGQIAISCRIMETRLYNYFLSKAKTSMAFQQGMLDKNQFVHDGIIDMPRLFKKFIAHVNQTFSMDKDHKFLEENGREIFLTYLRPIINGIGNYYIEAQTRDCERMDVVIDYLGQQYVVELKIWRGNAYNERGEEQLSRYLEYFDLQTGYLLSFCFNQGKQPGLLPPVVLNGRTLIEAIV